MQDLIQLEKGDILTFEYPARRPLECLVNGKEKLRGRMVASGDRLSFQVKEVIEQPAPVITPHRALAVSAGGNE
jgi:flagellar motor switch protein FliM